MKGAYVSTLPTISDLRAQGLSEPDAQRWLTLQDRAAFVENFFTDRAGVPWRVRDYQRDSLNSQAPRKVHCDGRDVGKTTEIEAIACWAMVACPESEMLIATQMENQLFPLMNRIARRFESTPAFTPSVVETRRSPSWYFRFTNGFVLWGRIAGPRGTNFQGMHVDWQIVDEAQEMTDTAWGELYQALNGGGRRWVYGVPNGLRNTFYRMSQMPDAEQYNWPSTINPNFDVAKAQELVHLYGGRSTPGYIHRVLGQHGAPMHAVFSLDEYLQCVDGTVAFEDIALKEEDPFDGPEAMITGDYYLGCDLGYARDPSEFVVYRNEPPHLANVLRVHMEGVNYARQQQIIEALDAAYDFRGIGIDAGNSGRAVAHQLMALGEDWCEKIQAFEFGGRMALQPLPDGQLVRRRVKEFMTELLQRRMNEGTLRLPALADRESQYAAHTYTVGASGQIVYEKGNDHIIDADRCAVLRHYRDQLEEPAPSCLGVGLAPF
jgi:hypothetical protein